MAAAVSRASSQVQWSSRLRTALTTMPQAARMRITPVQDQACASTDSGASVAETRFSVVWVKPVRYVPPPIRARASSRAAVTVNSTAGRVAAALPPGRGKAVSQAIRMITGSTSTVE